MAARPTNVPLGGLHHPAEPRLERIRGLVDVVAVERVLHLEPERVPGAETDGRRAVRLALGQEALPHRLGAGRRQVQLEPVLPGVARARDDARHARHPATAEVVVADRRDVHVGQAPHQPLGVRPLDGDQPRLLAHVLRVHPAAPSPRWRADPRPVLVDVGGVHRHHVVVVGEPVQRQVVHDPAVLVAEERVLDLTHLERRDVVRREPLERRERIRPAELELAHVAHVEAAHGAPDRAMLLHDARVLDGHVPAAEGDHPGAQAHVGGMERSAFQRGLGLGHRGWSSRPRAVRKAVAIIPSPLPIFNRAGLRPRSRGDVDFDARRIALLAFVGPEGEHQPLPARASRTRASGRRRPPRGRTRRRPR